MECNFHLHPYYRMRRYLTLILLFCSLYAFAQKQDCSPHRGSPKVCDSIYRLCYDDAYAILNVHVQNESDEGYDSLFLSATRIKKYTGALICMYNGLEDSLADFRSYLHMGTVLRPDSTFNVSITLPQSAVNYKPSSTQTSGVRELDELIAKAGMKWGSRKTVNDSTFELNYTTPALVNVYCLTRRIHAISKKFVVGSAFSHFGHSLIDIYDDGQLMHVRLTENYACMPPEWPCEYIRRTFECRPGGYFRYEKFERGVYPWPDLPEDR
jgi:hypothetical protein